jgi:hypothetical protein
MSQLAWSRATAERAAGAAATTSILGVCFRLVAERRDDLAYVNAFMSAYDEPDDEAVDAQVAIDIVRGVLPAPAGGERVKVHSSKHAYWNFAGTVVSAEPRLVLWDGKGLAIRLESRGRRAHVTVDPELPPARAGEAVFHLCRSLALYMRRGDRGNLVHASAVECAGRAVLFIGGVNAGKSTLCAESVLRHGCRPLANDRVLVTAAELPVAISWPSYSSFVEGTLLDYPELEEAALAYERPSCPYRTQTWTERLSRAYTKDVKRIYPMGWFAGAAGTRFVRRAPLGLLLLTRLKDSGCTTLESLDSRSVAELADQTFDAVEPSFHPWHGLPAPSGAPALDDLIARMRRAGLAVYRYEPPAEELSSLTEVLRMVR